MMATTERWHDLLDWMVDLQATGQTDHYLRRQPIADVARAALTTAYAAERLAGHLTTAQADTLAAFSRQACAIACPVETSAFHAAIDDLRRRDSATYDQVQEGFIGHTVHGLPPTAMPGSVQAAQDRLMAALMDATGDFA
jgi:hypothetical protein